jgi:N-acetylneuraminic acid mutarotase
MKTTSTRKSHVHLVEHVIRRLLVFAAWAIGLANLQSAGAAGFVSTGAMSTPRHVHTMTLLSNGKVLAVGGGNASNSYLSSAEIYDPATGTWTPTGSMATGRSYHTATLLPNGKVLVTGGQGAGGSFLSSTELYDPATGTWTATGSLNTGRSFHTATLLSNGQLLVVGGYNAGSLTSAELYNTATGTCTATGSMPSPRHVHAAMALPDGKVLVVGGQNTSGTYLSSAALYDPTTGIWTTTGSVSRTRRHSSLVLLSNGKVLIAGGDGGCGNITELFDPATGVWTATGNLTNGRRYQTVTLLPDGNVLVAGGQDYPAPERYNPSTGIWTPAGTMINYRYYHAAALLADGRVLFAGGHTGSGHLSSAELYDPSVSSWSGANSLSSARYAHTATLLPSGKVLVTGGQGNTDILASTELFDPTSGSWTTTGSMTSMSRDHTATLLSNGKVLVAGGRGSPTYLSRAELYDPSSGSWTTTGPMISNRYGHSATLLPKGKLLVAGGYNNSGFVANAEIYDPALGGWAPTGAMNTARSLHTATLLPNGKVLVAGGYNSSGLIANAEIFDPATGTWTTTGALNSTRRDHTATLLPNGKVLVAGGYNNSVVTSAELYNTMTGVWTSTTPSSLFAYLHEATLLPNGKVFVSGGQLNNTDSTFVSSAIQYDPATGGWAGTAAMVTARREHTATLLPNGKVLIVGGQGFAGILASAELYDVGLGFNAAWKPQIANITSPLILGGSLELSGTGFCGLSGSSGGYFQDSSSDFPVVQLRSLDSGQTLFTAPTIWSENSYVSSPVTGMPSGWAMATVFVNGIPSTSNIINLTLSSNAALSNLVVGSGALVPAFASSTSSYACSVSYTTTSVTVTPTTADITATVRLRINGGIYSTVVSGAPSGALALNPGLNWIDIVVTAADGTEMFYTVGVTRKFPIIRVRNGQADLVDSGIEPVSLGAGTREKPAGLTLTITNDGTDDLILGTIGKDGMDPDDFTVGAPLVTTLASGLSTTCAVSFVSGTSGAKTAVIHIASNVSGDANPFDITLSGTSLSYTNDTDFDGMNDAAEFNLAGFGFDWQNSQSTLVSNFYAGASSAGLFTPSQVQALHIGTPLLSRDPANGKFKLTLGIKKSSDLTHFTPFPMTPSQTGINANGELEFQFDSVDREAFFRLEAK